jgi:hypothetical protein
MTAKSTAPKLTEAQALAGIAVRPLVVAPGNVDALTALVRQGLARVDGPFAKITEAGRKAVEPFEFCDRCRGKAAVRDCPDCHGTGRKAVGK